MQASITCAMRRCTTPVWRGSGGTAATTFHARRRARLTAAAPSHSASAFTTMHSTLPSPCCATALVCSTRTFYDKIREKRDGSDDGPEQMFEDFAKSPHRQRVPAELHRGNKDAVDRAEILNRIFFVFLLFLVSGGVYFVDPFHDDQRSRPEGYGVTDPKKNVYGSSDRV